MLTILKRNDRYEVYTHVGIARVGQQIPVFGKMNILKGVGWNLLFAFNKFHMTETSKWKLST
jgi:hypothetical protein